MALESALFVFSANSFSMLLERRIDELKPVATIVDAVATDRTEAEDEEEEEEEEEEEVPGCPSSDNDVPKACARAGIGACM